MISRCAERMRSNKGRHRSISINLRERDQDAYISKSHMCCNVAKFFVVYTFNSRGIETKKYSLSPKWDVQLSIVNVKSVPFYTMANVKLALWLVERALRLEYRCKIDVIEWCARRTWSDSRVQSDWSTFRWTFATVFVITSGQTQTNFRKKGKLSDERLDKRPLRVTSTRLKKH